MTKLSSPNATSLRKTQISHLPIKVITLAAIAALSLTACTTVRAQSNQASAQRVSLASGTIIPVTLNTELTSNGSSQGDTFTTTVDTSKEAYDNILRGATISGVVHKATPQDGAEPGMLDLAFTSLRLADGRTYPLTGTLTSMDAKKLDISSTGLLKAKNTRKNSRLTYAGVGAGAGVLVGVLGGHKLKVEDVLIGALAGYGIGSIVKNPEQVHDVALKPGTPMGVLLTRRVGFVPEMGGTPQRYHRTYTRDGIKYYQVNGQPWAMRLATGERYPVSGTPPSATKHGKYYTYQGHPYYLNSDTGERTQLD
jgi:hypothetical protein